MNLLREKSYLARYLLLHIVYKIVIIKMCRKYVKLWSLKAKKKHTAFDSVLLNYLH